MSFIDLLNTTCTIYRLSGISGYDFSASTDGSVTESWEEVEADVRCRIDRSYERANRKSEGFVKAGSRSIYLPVGTDLRMGDRILANGVYYSVSDSDAISGMRDYHHIEGAIEIIDWEYSS
jgi:hypothetical protein